MTIKTTTRALFAAVVTAVTAGTFSPQAVAQARPQIPLPVRQRAAQEAFHQRQEAAARKKGNFNTAYWAAKDRQMADYWNHKSNPAQPKETSQQFSMRQRRGREAFIQRQEAAARKKGTYNAAYWATKERQNADYWNKKGVR